MMNFILFNLLLLIASFGAVFLFSILLMLIMSPLMLADDPDNVPKIFMYPFIGISGAYQIYFWSLWAAYCVATTYKFTSNPETWNWLYFIFGFIWCISLIGWLNYKEQQSTYDISERKKIQSGSTFYKSVAVICFITFTIWPGLMSTPFGWALKFLV